MAADASPRPRRPVAVREHPQSLVHMPDLSTGRPGTVARRPPARNARSREHSDIGHRRHHVWRRARPADRRRRRLPRDPLRRRSGGRPPLPGAGTGARVERHPRGCRARPDGADAGLPATVRRAAAESGDPGRRVPQPERVDPGPGRAGPAGVRLDPRWRVRQRLQRRTGDRRLRLRPRRRRHGRDQLPARRRGVRAPARRTAEPRPPRPGGGPGMGTRQHRGLRRRPGQP